MTEHRLAEQKPTDANESLGESDEVSIAEWSGLSFEQAVEVLEGLIRKLEDNRLPLEESFQSYQQATELLQYCQGLLVDVEQKILVLNDRFSTQQST